MGRHARLGRGIRWRIEPGAVVVLGDDCEIDDGVTIGAAAGSRLELGAGVFVGHHSTIAARGSVIVGAGTFCAELVSIRDHDHDPASPPATGVNLVEPVSIGRECWLAAKTTITRGVTIHDRAVVGANAVVTRDVPAQVIVGGIPARVIRPVSDAASHP